MVLYPMNFIPPVGFILRGLPRPLSWEGDGLSLLEQYKLSSPFLLIQLPAEASPQDPFLIRHPLAALSE
jgi:hypothetical protein